ncbi:hypothetical protein GH808_14125 [Acetobacterium fimetarium]|uniref:Uncharacterized protein n=1 Tax=Acetobacterium fimetarium TaxID=52691 RepID=A0ABR6WY94_9FIRM|nr:hypothetical protein [Acetobacterium fimetarium]MBC3805551.1 hypothetical protein [Acetobacterium fimetarium]
MTHFNKLNDAELLRKFEMIKEDLEDVENEKKFTANQSGVHTSAGKVIAQMEEFESEISELKEQIAQCSEEIKKRGLSK